MNSKFEIFEDALIVFWVALSVDMIKSILGIILLVIQICLILYKGIRLAYKHAKDKNYQEVIKAIDDMTKDIQEQIDKTGEDGKSNDSK